MRLPGVLSNREWEVLHQLAVGKSNKEIAGVLSIAVGTVQNHLHSIYEKLGVSSRTEAIAWHHQWVIEQILIEYEIRKADRDLVQWLGSAG
ncbi:MAG: helix-turn-helix transcriptional regulator [Caldilineaceae bacterium]|nr:helix-turn-helix transcriptional regulator [Caldilineaceae bacterium]